VNKKWVWLLIVIVLVSCGGTSGTATPAPPPAPSGTFTAPPLATPTEAGAETPTSELEYMLTSYGLALHYDPERWEETESKLQNREVFQCVMEEQGPTEAPEITMTVTLNGIVYDVSEFQLEEDQAIQRWYLAREGFSNPNPGTTPIVVVTAAKDSATACFSDAEEVLGTLFNPAGSS
jgi:hypothetical protein